MSKKTVISLYCKSFCFRLYMFFRGNNMFVWFPVITCYCSHFMMSYCFPKFLCRLVAPVANNEGDKSFSISINSNPYQTVVFLNLYKNAFHLLLPFRFLYFQHSVSLLLSQNSLFNSKQKHCSLPKIFRLNENQDLQDIDTMLAFLEILALMLILIQPYNYIHTLCICSVVFLWLFLT